MRQTIPIRTRTEKKKRSETGAKNDIRDATGPGFATDGIPIAIDCALFDRVARSRTPLLEKAVPPDLVPQ